MAGYLMQSLAIACWTDAGLSGTRRTVPLPVVEVSLSKDEKRFPCAAFSCRMAMPDLRSIGMSIPAW
jgi:hypothetical protein